MENNKFKLDGRKQKDVENEIKSLAACYAPEWRFDKENPDAGSVIAILYSKMLTDNIEKFNELIDRCHIEFVNMLGVSLLSAQPASTTVVLNLIQDTIDGTFVKKGEKLLGNDGISPVIFETTQPVFVTNSKLQEIFMIQAYTGKIIPIIGKMKQTPLLAEENTEEEEIKEGQKPFSLFSFSEEGIDRNALILYHSRIFDIENQNIYMRVGENESFLKGIEKGDFTLSYYTDNGFTKIENFERKGNTIVFKKENPCAKIRREKECSVLVIEAVKSVEATLELPEISFSSAGDFVPLSFASNGNSDLDVEEFEPFTDTLSLFSECYIGQEIYFSKAGAKITLQFELNVREHTVELTKQQVNDELKIIKRKPRNISSDTIAETFAEEISIEYYNGLGWKRLNFNRDCKRLFEKEAKDLVELTFLAPKDWEEMAAFGHTARCIRIQLLKADNCYMMPCRHHYPVLMNMRVAYSYESRYEKPDFLERIHGTKRTDLTGFVREDSPIPAFPGSEYTNDSLFLGFSERPEAGPVGLYLELDDKIISQGRKYQFSYSSRNGFKQIRVEDGTMNLTRSGLIRFMPPEDMAPVNVEGVTSCYLRLTKQQDGSRPESIYRPVIRQLLVNAVEVHNVDTQAREDFYLDELKPDQIFHIGDSNILDVEVWVNEMGSIPVTKMQTMLREYPDTVHAEYDISGNIQEFYVLWQEVDNFQESEPKDRHYLLERMTGNIQFGDGIHVRMPRVADGVAFYTIVKNCDGMNGNVSKGSIEESMSQLPFIDTITNLYPAYGGSNVESLENALKRGANAISSRRRLVTRNDFCREILAVSDTVDKVSCVMEQAITGERRPGLLSFVLLMKEFEGGSLAFEKLLPKLKKHLRSNCEYTIPDEMIQIVEPIEVMISVDVWMEQSIENSNYEIQEVLENELKLYLSPVTTPERTGWNIGTLPRESQIMMKLNSLKIKNTIRKLLITASYTDANGAHQCELNDMPENPFYICNSGTHKIHLFLEKEG